MQKNTKSLLLCLLLICVSFNVFSQEKNDDNKKKTRPVLKHQIGINIASFVDRFLKFNNNTNSATDPSLFSYRYQINERTALRAGFSVSMLNENLTTTTSSLPRKSTSNSHNVRLGFEYFLLKTPSWRAGIGVDLIESSSYANSSQRDSIQGTTFESTSKDLNFGAGPIVSLQYYLARRVTIGTQAGLYFLYGKSKDVSKISGNFFQESKTEFTISRISSEFPISLFLNFNF